MAPVEGSPRVERLCRLLIRLASPLAPAGRRAAWREEWDSEVWHHLRGPETGGRRPSGLRVLARCLGTFPHAIWIRIEEWSFEAMLSHLARTARRLAHDPAFSVSAVAVFSLAVAASATIFSSYEAVVMRGLGYDRPERLVSVWDEHAGHGWYQEYVAPANLFDWREQVDAFADVAAYGDYAHEQILLEGGDASVVDAAQVSGNFFDVLGVAPLLGRTFRMDETWSDSDPVVVLGHDFWLARYGGDPEGSAGASSSAASRTRSSASWARTSATSRPTGSCG